MSRRALGKVKVLNLWVSPEEHAFLKATGKRLSITVTQIVRDLVRSEAAAQRCRVCGCTDRYGCAAGCWWVKRNLCSECEGAVAGARVTKQDQAARTR